MKFYLLQGITDKPMDIGILDTEKDLQTDLPNKKSRTKLPPLRIIINSLIQ